MRGILREQAGLIETKSKLKNLRMRRTPYTMRLVIYL